MWNELLVAVALLFVIEGVWPFINPSGLRRTLLMIAHQGDHSLRVMGLVSMVAGVVMLYLVH